MRHIPLSIESHKTWLNGMLAHAPNARGLVLIAHTGTDEPHDMDLSLLTESLQALNFATLSVNLLSQEELTHTPDAAYNVSELEQRIFTLSEWGRRQPHMTQLHQSLLLSGTACAAGIRAASLNPWHFNAAICYDGRPDLAGRAPLSNIKVPVRFIVSHNAPHKPMLQQAFSLINGPKNWHLMEPVTHLSHPDASTQLLCRLTTEWLEKHQQPEPALSPEQQAISDQDTHIKKHF